MRELVYSKVAVGCIIFFSCLGSLLYGYDIGCTSVALSQLHQPISGVSWYSTVAQSVYYQGLIASASLIGAFMASLFIFIMSAYYSSMHLLLSASSAYIIGSFFEMWSFKLGLNVFILSRIIYGLGMGFSSIGSAAYLADMLPSSIRGCGLAMKETFTMFGLFLGYTIGIAFEKIEGGWAMMYIMALPIAIIMLVGLLAFPHSYRWLISHSYQNDAIYAIQVIYPQITNVEIQEKFNSMSHMDNYENISLCVKLATPKTFTSFWISLLIILFQQFSGQPTILYFLHTLLDTIGANRYSVIWLSAIMLITTFITPFLIEKIGRKLLLSIGCILMLLTLLVAGTLLSVTSLAEYQSDIVIVVVCLCIYIAGFEYSFGTVTWTLIAEISPSDSRELILSASKLSDLFLNFFVATLFPVEVEDIGVANAFFIYAAIIFCFLLFLSTNIIPETKDLSLEEIERVMMQRWSPSSYTYLDIE